MDSEVHRDDEASRTSQQPTNRGTEVPGLSRDDNPLQTPPASSGEGHSDSPEHSTSPESNTDQHRPLYAERYEQALDQLTRPWTRPEPGDLSWELVEGEASAHYAEALASCDIRQAPSTAFDLVIEVLEGKTLLLDVAMESPASCIRAGYPARHRDPVLASLTEADCALLLACQSGFEALAMGSQATELANFDMGDELGMLPFIVMPKLLLLDAYLRSSEGLLVMVESGLVALRVSQDLRRRSTLIQSMVSIAVEGYSLQYLTGVLIASGPDIAPEQLELIRRELLWLDRARAATSEIWLREWVWGIPLAVEGLDTDGILTGRAEEGSPNCYRNFSPEVCASAAEIYTAVIDSLAELESGSLGARRV